MSVIGWQGSSQPQNLDQLRQQCAIRLHHKLQDPRVRAKTAAAVFPVAFQEVSSHSHEIDAMGMSSSIASRSTEAPPVSIDTSGHGSSGISGEVEPQGSVGVQRRHPAVPVLPLRTALSASRSPSPTAVERPRPVVRGFVSATAARARSTSPGRPQRHEDLQPLEHSRKLHGSNTRPTRNRPSSSGRVSTSQRQRSQPRWTRGGLFGEYRPLSATENANERASAPSQFPRKTSPTRRSLGLQQRACMRPTDTPTEMQRVSNGAAPSQEPSGHPRRGTSPTGPQSRTQLRAASPTLARPISPPVQLPPCNASTSTAFASGERTNGRRTRSPPRPDSRSIASRGGCNRDEVKRGAALRHCAGDSGNPRDAADVVRRAVPCQDTDKRAAPSLAATMSPFAEDGPWASNVVEEIQLSDCSPSFPSVLLCSPSQFSEPNAAALLLEAAHTDNALAPTLQRLIQENESLREAFSDASQRLSQLEDEKLRLLDEGVFDLVNSVCGKPTVDIGRVIAGQGMSVVAMSPEKAITTELRRAEEETRSAQLSGENEELRQELVRTARMGEALERQQQVAEDRMHALEQEKVWLAERSARLAHDGEASPSTGSSAVDAGTGAGVGSLRGGLALRTVAPSDITVASVLEDVNRALRVELADAGRRHDELVVRSQRDAVTAAGLEQEGSKEQLRLHEVVAAAQEEATVAELGRQRSEQTWASERTQVISNLGGEAEALQRKLRDSEARAQALAEDNARLQAALIAHPKHTDDVNVPTNLLSDASNRWESNIYGDAGSSAQTHIIAGLDIDDVRLKKVMPTAVDVHGFTHHPQQTMQAAVDVPMDGGVFESSAMPGALLASTTCGTTQLACQEEVRPALGALELELDEAW